MSANNQTGFPPGQQWSRKWGKNQIVKCNFVTHHQFNVVRCLVITKLMGDDGVCVCAHQIRLNSPKEATNYIYTLVRCLTSRHLHSSAETCDFAVSSNSCCCESHNKIKWWRALPKLHLQWKMGVAMQWTMPKILNGVNDAPFFFLVLSFFHSYCCFMGKINNK